MNTASAASSASSIAERYLAVWNERDASARRARVAQLFAPDASYADPMMKSRGIDGIDAMIGAFHSQFPGCRFSLHGVPDGHNDVVRFSWTLGLEDAAPLANGTDVVRIDADGRLRQVTGFLNAA